MRIAYLDHFVTYTVDYKGLRGPGMRVDLSPGLVDVEIYPHVAAHTYGGAVRHERDDPRYGKLLRCCQACEARYRVESPADSSAPQGAAFPPAAG